MFEGINGAIQVAIIDIILVFAVLGGLALIIVSLKNVVGVKEGKKISKEVKITPPASSITSIKEKEEVDGKLVAVITAAVASYLEKPKSKFKILSIKKYQTSLIAPWSAMGRQELMSGRKQ
ncbi:MAG: OadG family protein [Candidatus Caldatribacteriota bacterium]|nr:OadG family protein [Candidatus Caldatribacteriota bacterium]